MNDEIAAMLAAEVLAAVALQRRQLERADPATSVAVATSMAHLVAAVAPLVAAVAPIRAAPPPPPPPPVAGTYATPAYDPDATWIEEVAETTQPSLPHAARAVRVDRSTGRRVYVR